MRTFAKFVVSTSIAASALLTALMAGGPSAIAADGNEEQRRARYEKCIALAQTDPEAARRDAAKWKAIGGGAQAQHCAAIALIGQGATREAAQILTEIGSGGDSGLGAEDRVSMLSLAGVLWLQLGRHALAGRCFDGALKIQHDHRPALLGAAHVAASQGDHSKAEKHLTQQIKKQSADAEALTFRAAARRLQGKKKAALADAEKASKLSPGSAPAWFEKGAAERALGEKKAARESWIKAAMLDLTGQIGEDARHALAVLDAGD